MQLNDTTLAAGREVLHVSGQIVAIVFEASQIPGAEGIVKLVELIYEKAKQALKLKGELLDLSARCGKLLKALTSHCERMQHTDMPLPLGETKAAASHALAVVERYEGYGTLRTWLHNSKIQDDLDACKKEINEAIDSLKLEASLIVRQIPAIGEDMTLVKAEITAARQETQDLRRILLRDPNQVATMSVEEGATDADRTQKIIKEMRADKDKPDYELQVAGVKVSRAQYNVVYLDLVKYLNNIESYTGQRPQDTDLGNLVTIDDDRAEAEGMYTEVYCGTYLGQKVAVKALRGRDRNFDRAKKRLLQEFAIWPTLKHRNIQTFIGWTEACTQNVAMVSPWQTNGNITRYCAEHRNANRLHLLAGAADGLRYLHVEKSIVHGSLKGSNILITDQDEAVITDFSVAAIYTELVNKSSLSLGSMTQTPSARWQAVEVSAYGKRPTLKSDVWSMAMTVYEVLTGTAPFIPEIRAEFQVISALMQGHRPQRPEGNKWMSDGLWEFMQQCWSKEPDQRPDATQLLEKLKEAESGYVPPPATPIFL